VILLMRFVKLLERFRVWVPCNFYIDPTENFSLFSGSRVGFRRASNLLLGIIPMKLETGLNLFRSLARHRRCDVYCGARETVGESSVSSGCWGEDSDHKNGWARRTPTYVAPIRFFASVADSIQGILFQTPL
jgi:hypothetical protein